MSFAIVDLSGGASQYNAFDNALKTRNTGISIHLEIDQENNSLVSKLDGNRKPFGELAEAIRKALEADTLKLLPLFIDFNGPPNLLKEEIANSGLKRYTHYQPIGERWGDIDEMMRKNQRLIIFTFQRIHQGNNMFHYIWNYIADFPKSISETPYFDGNYPNGHLKNELLMVRDFISTFSEITGYDKRFFDNNQNTYFLNYMINCWKYTGKKPNLFLVPANHPKHRDVLKKISTYQQLNGVVEYLGKPIEKVLWKHSDRIFTYGFFSFPYIEGEELSLAPLAPGFKFTPENIVINQEGNLPDVIHFTANPLPLHEELTGYFPFDKNLDNQVPKAIPVTNRNTQIISDIERGNVLKFPDQSYLILGKPNDYKIQGSSFTVSSWFKLRDVTSQRDYCILGTQETSFRKGLHLVIRDARPYFGFFGNDLWSETTIAPETWYHIVFRYNIHNGEQAIFINGNAVGSSLNHASFIGESDLIVGHGLKQINFLNGYIDELCIWDRPLGVDEIQSLYFESEELLVKKSFNFVGILLTGVFIILALLGILYWQSRRKLRLVKKLTKPRVLEKRPDSIFLFGDFCVFNHKGENISALFTPKIKELFLLLLTNTLRKDRGIRTEQLTDLLWPDKTRQKAANNRSVNINKLRKLTEQINGLDVVFENGRWSIELSDDIFCDYASLLEITKLRTHKEQHYLDICAISMRGVFLNNSQYPWLDETKGKMTNEVIDLLLKYAEHLVKTDNREMLESVVQRILMADDLNENALRFQLALLNKQNSRHLAQFTFKQFQKNYKETYNTTYPYSFDEFINKRS